MEQLGSHWKDFSRNLILIFNFRKSVQDIQDSLKSDDITDTLHEDQNTFVMVSRLVLFRIGNVTNERYREIPNKNFTFNNDMEK